MDLYTKVESRAVSPLRAFEQRATAVSIAVTLALGMAMISNSAFATDPPGWAYPLNPPDYKPAPDDGKLQRVPNSIVSFSIPQTRNLFFTPDWHPGDHAPMPTVVALGRKPDVYACGFCHRATGPGGPENANLTGLPFDYIGAQMRDYRSGARTSALPDRAPQRLMIKGSKNLTDEEINEAAAYFSALKPKQNIRVVETETIPQPVVANWTWVDHKTGKREPLAKRIIEVPEHLEDFELRDARTTFIAYVPPGSLKRGEALVKGTVANSTIACATCHGEALRGMTVAPPIAGRSASYAMRQLYEFKTGVRIGSNAALMKPVVENLNSDDMLAIVAYLASRTP